MIPSPPCFTVWMMMCLWLSAVLVFRLRPKKFKLKCLFQMFVVFSTCGIANCKRDFCRFSLSPMAVFSALLFWIAPSVPVSLAGESSLRGFAVEWFSIYFKMVDWAELCEMFKAGKQLFFFFFFKSNPHKPPLLLGLHTALNTFFIFFFFRKTGNHVLLF